MRLITILHQIYQKKKPENTLKNTNLLEFKQSLKKSKHFLLIVFPMWRNLNKCRKNSLRIKIFSRLKHYIFCRFLLNFCMLTFIVWLERIIFFGYSHSAISLSFPSWSTLLQVWYSITYVEDWISKFTCKFLHRWNNFIVSLRSYSFSSVLFARVWTEYLILNC